MGNIQLAVEGQDAVEATKSLLAIPELSGEWQPVDGNQKALTLATIATIVGIVGGTLKVAEQIHKWYKHWKEGKADHTIDKVVIVGADGQRLVLENASVEEISTVLEGLAK